MYCHAIGSAATYIAPLVEKVLGVYRMDFGVPGPVGGIQGKASPFVVTMDVYGGSLHQLVEEQSGKVLAELLAKQFTSYTQEYKKPTSFTPGF